jgi:phosphoenolpyruvate carboxykinase (GTP)
MAQVDKGKTTNQRLVAWVEEVAALTKPDDIYWCDGSQEEYDLLSAQMVESGMLIPLNQELRPGCFLARSDPNDVARVENRTFVCWDDPEDA